MWKWLEKEAGLNVVVWQLANAEGGVEAADEVEAEVGLGVGAEVGVQWIGVAGVDLDEVVDLVHDLAPGLDKFNNYVTFHHSKPLHACLAG